MWGWRRLLRVLWTAKRSKQSILKEINPEYSLEGLMLKLRLQYFGLRIWKANSLEKTLILRKTEGRRRSGWQRISRLDGIRDSVEMSLSKLPETVKDKELGMLYSPWGSQRLGNWINNIYEPIYETETEFTDVENKLLVTKGEKREG